MASNEVTFDVTATTNGSDVSLEGGLTEGETWNDPLGVAGVEVSAVRLVLDAPDGETPTFSITVGTNIDTGGDSDIGIEATVEVNDEIAVGDDEVRGDQADDQVFGGAGDDFVAGNNGIDTCDGGTGGEIAGDTAASNCETVVNIP